jgi:probable HAF family extracellular repeat protein
MKLLTVPGIVAMILFAVFALPVETFAQQSSNTHDGNSGTTHYTIVDLGLVGAPPGQPYMISNNALVAGAVATQDGSEHATLWFKTLRQDIGARGLGGPNSMAFGVDERGEAVGTAQTSDPDGEDFCGFNAYGFPASNTTCLPFLWRHGAMHPLPTLGGANGVANMINDRGEAVGYAETAAQESNCPVHQFEPVIWKNGKPYELPTYTGDSNGVAAWINDRGQVVGSSGACAPFNPNSQLYLSENHALLWDDRTVIDLGNLGGTGGLAGNHACAINNRSQVVGHSELPNDTTFHAFVWARETLMQDLGTLSGDYASLAIGINDEGKIVGASLDGNFNPRAYVWENGVMTDLNIVATGSSKLYLLLAESINDRGEIIGFGATDTGDLHGFLAIPCDTDHDAHLEAGAPRPALTETARQLLRQQLAHRHHVGGLH